MHSGISSPLIRRARRHRNMSMLFRMRAAELPHGATGRTSRPPAVTKWVMGRAVGEPRSLKQDGAGDSIAPMPAKEQENRSVVVEQQTTADPPPSARQRTGLRAALAQVIQPFRQLTATQRSGVPAAMPDSDAPAEEMTVAEKEIIHQLPADTTMPVVQAKIVGQSRALIDSTPPRIAMNKAAGANPGQTKIVPVLQEPEARIADTVPDPPAVKAEAEGPNWPVLMAIMEAHERKQQQEQYPGTSSPAATTEPKAVDDRPTDGPAVTLPEESETQDMDYQPFLSQKKRTESVQREPEDAPPAEAMAEELEGPPAHAGVEEAAPPDVDNHADNQQSGQIQAEEPHSEPAVEATEQHETALARPTEAEATVDSRGGSGSGESRSWPDRLDRREGPSDIDVEAMLRQTPPAKRTNSAIHVIAPRGRKPLQMRPNPEATSAQKIMKTAAEAQHSEPVVETEIGDLPVDLWALIGESPPTPQGDAVTQKAQYAQIDARYNEDSVAPSADRTLPVQMTSDGQQPGIEPLPGAELHQDHSGSAVPKGEGKMSDAVSAFDTGFTGARYQDPSSSADVTDGVLSTSSSHPMPGQTLHAAALVHATAPAPARVTGQAPVSAANEQRPEQAIQSSRSDVAPALQRQPLDIAIATLMRMEQVDSGIPDPEPAANAPDHVDGRTESEPKSEEDEPDLTTLALRVYAQIRRRLIIEQERLR